MALELLTDVNFTDTTIPYLELDSAIVRPYCQGMYDLSNSSCYASGGSSITAGTTIKSLTSDYTTATSGGTLAYANGMVDISVASNSYFDLPTSKFKLPNTTKKFMFICWLKIPTTGFQTTSNFLYNFFGCASGVGTLAQWGIYGVNTAASSALTQISIIRPTSGTTSGSLSLTGSALAAIADGNLHQVAYVWDGESISGSFVQSVYVDKTLVSSGTVTWDGTFVVPSTAPARIGFTTAYNPQPATGTKVGRVSLWNLTSSGLTATDIIANDYLNAQGYLS